MHHGMEPDWILAAKSAPENVKFIDINAEKESKLTKRFRVRGYPTILVFSRGHALFTFHSERTPEKFKAVYEKLIDNPVILHESIELLEHKILSPLTVDCSGPSPTFTASSQTNSNFFLLSHEPFKDTSLQSLFSHFESSASKYRPTPSRFHFIPIPSSESDNINNFSDSLTTFLLHTPLSQSFSSSSSNTSSFLKTIYESAVWKYDSNTTAHILRTGAFPLASEDSCSYRRAPLHSAVLEWMKLKDSFLLISSSLDGRAVQYFPITSTKVLFSLFPFLAEPAEPLTPPSEKSLTKQNRKEDSYYDSLKPSTHPLIIDNTPLTVCSPFENWIWDRLFAPATYLNPEMTEWLVARRAPAIFATIPDISGKRTKKKRQPKAEPATVTQENQETGEAEGSLQEDEDAAELIRKNCLKNTFTTENLNIRAIRPSHFSPTLTHRAYTLAALHLSYTSNSLSTDALLSSSQAKHLTPFVSMNTQYYDSFTKYFLVAPPSLLPTGTSNGPSTAYLPMVFFHDYSTKETWTEFGAFSLNWQSCVEFNAHVASPVTRSPVGITEWTTTNDFSDNVAIMVLPSEDNQTSILDAASIDNALQSSDAALLTPTPALLARIITQFVGDIRFGRVPSRVQVTPRSEKFEN
ncbi:hypothetical protein BLNAU_3545 [Blattamonas nauphoetae]|uniref:Thioredoxin domain-containing protein n=1 Tax=Blattamonas nauphoetae TaxID=2049346 RepID=A0ABQ9YCH2_9EUKA|nr:hypothetical protein BLNAU_3545 [Blattamonas nauphoetae]